MIQTIHIGHLLRETVASPYRNLVTRPTGAAIRNRIQETMADSDCLTALLDFSGIELLDFSCADEVVAKLLLAAEERGGRFVVLQGLREDQHEAIEHVLTHHRLAIAAVGQGEGHAEPRLLGWVTPDARAAFTCVCARGALTAHDLAARLDWMVARAETALAALAGHRLLRAEDDRYLPLPIA
jgi:sugar/nucleoside kinase (ribokinase family)